MSSQRVRKSAKLASRLVAASLLSGLTFAEPAQAKDEPRTTAQTQNHLPFFAFGELQAPPSGYKDFCEREEEYCTPDKAGHAPVAIPMNAQRWAKVKHINRTVNRTVLPATDLEKYGVPEFWTITGITRYGVPSGDCEDVAMDKRERLIAAGWPRNAVLMTVVRDHQQAWHVVLSLVTTDGIYALDNLTDKVLLWSETGYGYSMVQDWARPSQWRSVVLPAARQYDNDQQTATFRSAPAQPRKIAVPSPRPRRK